MPAIIKTTHSVNRHEFNADGDELILLQVHVTRKKKTVQIEEEEHLRACACMCV